MIKNIIIFMFVVIAMLELFDISREDIKKKILYLFNLQKKEYTIKDKIKMANLEKKENTIVLLIKETRKILKSTGRTTMFSTICLTSVFLSVVGIFLSLLIGNIFLVPILAIGFFMIPFQYIKISEGHYKSQISHNLESALFSITNTYMRTSNIIAAVQDNVEEFEPSIRKEFEFFLIGVGLEPDVKKVLVKLKDRIDNDIFKEWIKRVIDCQNDNVLKSPLKGIVKKFSKVKVLNKKCENELIEPIRNFYTLVIGCYSLFGIFYFLKRDLFDVLMFTNLGRVCVAIAVLMTFICIHGVLRLKKPVDYKMLK
ncbi:hypothetical protein MJU95_016570 [Clostridioides difficile]|nr:hypothetical protein [Clostridioides difficile]